MRVLAIVLFVVTIACASAYKKYAGRQVYYRSPQYMRGPAMYYPYRNNGYNDDYGSSSRMGHGRHVHGNVVYPRQMFRTNYVASANRNGFNGYNRNSGDNGYNRNYDNNDNDYRRVAYVQPNYYQAYARPSFQTYYPRPSYSKYYPRPSYSKYYPRPSYPKYIMPTIQYYGKNTMSKKRTYG